MITITRIGIAIFTFAVLSGPAYTNKEYSVISNLISELGAQNTQNNFIMIIAFTLLGSCIAIDGVRKFHISLLPFIFFGFAMAIVGIFPHKPLDTSINYNPTYHNLHGVIAGIAGTVITIGFIWQGFRTIGKQRIVCLYMAFTAIIFPVFMLSCPDYKGIIQRVMYIQILGWLWIKYPMVLAGKQLKFPAKDKEN